MITPVCRFHDDAEVNFFRGSDGEIYFVEGPLPESIKNVKSLGSAVIDVVDPLTNTIWFKSPLPDGVTI
jgi:hypothetical protein